MGPSACGLGTKHLNLRHRLLPASFPGFQQQSITSPLSAATTFKDFILFLRLHCSWQRPLRVFPRCLIWVLTCTVWPTRGITREPGHASHVPRWEGAENRFQAWLFYQLSEWPRASHRAFWSLLPQPQNRSIYQRGSVGVVDGLRNTLEHLQFEDSFKLIYAMGKRESPLTLNIHLYTLDLCRILVCLTWTKKLGCHGLPAKSLPGELQAQEKGKQFCGMGAHYSPWATTRLRLTFNMALPAARIKRPQHKTYFYLSPEQSPLHRTIDRDINSGKIRCTPEAAREGQGWYQRTMGTGGGLRRVEGGVPVSHLPPSWSCTCVCVRVSLLLPYVTYRPTLCFPEDKDTCPAKSPWFGKAIP